MIMHRPKKILRSEVVHKNPWYQVRQDHFLRDSGKEGVYYSIVSDPFVIICALDASRKQVRMVKNWRYPVRRYVTEFPMGWREKNETPLMAAKRELLEETGYTAKKWDSLGWFYLAPGISTQRGYVFAAQRLVKAKKAKRSEEVVSDMFVTVGKLSKQLKDDKIMDAPTQVAARMLLDRLKTLK